MCTTSCRQPFMKKSEPKGCRVEGSDPAMNCCFIIMQMPTTWNYPWKAHKPYFEGHPTTQDLASLFDDLSCRRPPFDMALLSRGLLIIRATTVAELSWARVCEEVSIEGAIKSDINCKYDLHFEKKMSQPFWCVKFQNLKTAVFYRNAWKIAGACKQVVATDKLCSF